MWPVSGSRQGLEAGRRWLNAGGLKKEEKTRRRDSPPAVGGPCRHIGLDVCCFCFFIWTYCGKQYQSFLLEGLLAAGFTLVPFPSQNPELPQPRCFPRSCAPSAPALSCLHGSIPQAWNCLLLYLYSTRLAQALGHCCSESDYGEQPREAILARSAWESAAPSPGPSQGAAELLPSQP